MYQELVWTKEIKNLKLNVKEGDDKGPQVDTKSKESMYVDHL